MSLANGHNQSKLPKTFLNFICKQTNKNLFYNNNNINSNNNNTDYISRGHSFDTSTFHYVIFHIINTLTKDE